MQSAAAELRDSREFLPGQWLQRWHAPRVAAAARAGQYVHVQTPDLSASMLRRPLSVNTADRSTGEITLHFRAADVVNGYAASCGASLARLHPGDRLDLVGPLGRGFEVDPRSRHLLLIAGGMGIAAVRSLVDQALVEGRRITLLFGARTATGVYPSSLLPEEVEYVVATDDGSIGHHGPISELVPRYEAWADQAFAAGPVGMLAAVSRLAAGRDGRLGVARLGRKSGTRSAPAGSPQARRAAWLQVALEQVMGCATGTCLGCVVNGTDGPQRACREGPTFAATELTWARE